jgi:hypothetical protein
MEELKRKIEEELQKTGLPTEIKVNKVLSDKKWEVYPNDPYSDPITQKIRSIDFRAELRKIDKEVDLDKPEETIVTASCQLYIECKSGNTPWIFYVDENIFNVTRQLGFQTGFKLGKISRKKRNISGLDKVTDYHTLLIPTISFNYQVVFGRDNFYDAQMQVLNSIDSSPFIDDFEKHLLYPLIIYEGNIFKYTYGKEMVLEETDFIRYLTGGIPSNRLSTFIDVITLEYLPHYLDSVRKEFIDFSGARILFSDVLRINLNNACEN